MSKLSRMVIKIQTGHESLAELMKSARLNLDRKTTNLFIKYVVVYISVV